VATEHHEAATRERGLVAVARAEADGCSRLAAFQVQVGQEQACDVVHGELAVARIRDVVEPERTVVTGQLAQVIELRLQPVAVIELVAEAAVERDRAHADQQVAPEQPAHRRVEEAGLLSAEQREAKCFERMGTKQLPEALEFRLGTRPRRMLRSLWEGRAHGGAEDQPRTPRLQVYPSRSSAGALYCTLAAFVL